MAGARREEEEPAEAANGVSLGIIAVSLVILLLLFFLASDIPAYKRTLLVIRRRLSDVKKPCF